MGILWYSFVNSSSCPLCKISVLLPQALVAINVRVCVLWWKCCVIIWKRCKKCCTLHCIELPLCIADKGDADIECGAQVAQNVQAAVICYTECTWQRRRRWSNWSGNGFSKRKSHLYF
jgi:hypothetical protein